MTQREQLMTDGGVKWGIPLEGYTTPAPVWGGGIALFYNLDLPTLQKLAICGFADPEVEQDHGPTTRAMLISMKANPNLLAEGYIVEEERPDCRITLTRLYLPK